MNLDQMRIRCPNAQVVGKVQLVGYEMAFAGEDDNGVATIRPKLDSEVEGVLWKITDDCEQSLDRYEGFPNLYGKEEVTVQDTKGRKYRAMVYSMNAPYALHPAVPSNYYLQTILTGCEQNGLRKRPVLRAARRTQAEVNQEYKSVLAKKNRSNWER